MDFNEIYYGGVAKVAKELTAAEKRGGPIPDNLDFSVQPVCASCHQSIIEPKKPLRCSACKAVIYCSKECSKRDWNVPSHPNQPTHKDLCTDNKRHMERLSQTQAIAKSFPWGRLESDGTFSFDIARERFGVLGGSGCGFWSHRGGPTPHSEKAVMSMESSPYSARIQSLLKGFDHMDGNDLIKKKHLSDEEGWKLPPRFIPYRTLSTSAKRPELVTDFKGGVVDWDSCVYQMLVHSLDLTSPQAGRPDKRVALNIHLLGVEVELNYLPLFSELVLLLPYHDIKLVLFGAPVVRLVNQAKKSPGAVAAKSPVFTYTAPDECGSGALSIHLHVASPTWSASAGGKEGPPDALVACNAGLGAYHEWFPVIQQAHRYHIPFATTEYAEQSAEHQRNMMPIILRGAFLNPRSQYKIELNPFQRPGQRTLPMYRLPNAVNGFTLVVYKD